MSDRDSFRRFQPDDAMFERLLDRKRADDEIDALRNNEELRSEIRALREQGELEVVYAPEKGETQQATFDAKPTPAGSVPEPGAPKVKLAAPTDQMSRDELAKLRIPTGPAPVVASNLTVDGRLGDTNVVRKKRAYTDEEQKAARAEADAIFAANEPGSNEFMRGIAICQAFDLKLPVVDVDQIQAKADAAVREAIVGDTQTKPAVPSAASSGGGLARLQPHLDLAAANKPTALEEPFDREEPEASRRWLWLLPLLALLGGAIFWWMRPGTDQPADPLAVPVPTGAATTNNTVPTNTAQPTDTIPVPQPTAETTAPPSARPTVDVRPSAASTMRTAATSAAPVPSPSSTTTGLVPDWR